MNQPLSITGLETTITPNGKMSILLVSSPLGTQYKLGLDEKSADNIRMMIANEVKLLQALNSNVNAMTNMANRN